MANSATFSVSNKNLLLALKQLNKLEKLAKRRKITLEITLFQYYILLVVPGVELKVKASTNGSAKATVLLWYITDIVSGQKEEILFFTIMYNQIHLNGLVFNALTTHFDDDRILRSIQLPINFTFIDIARLYLSEKYTSDEMLFNNLSEKVVKSFKEVNEDIEKAYNQLAKYGVRKVEIEELMHKKLKGSDREGDS